MKREYFESSHILDLMKILLSDRKYFMAWRECVDVKMGMKGRGWEGWIRCCESKENKAKQSKEQKMVTQTLETLGGFFL